CSMLPEALVRVLWHDGLTMQGTTHGCLRVRTAVSESALAWAAYHLGVRVAMDAYGLGDEPLSNGHFVRQLEMLREIAEGRLTLHHSPDELLEWSGELAALDEALQRATQEVVRRERQAATIVWEMYVRVLAGCGKRHRKR